MMRGHKDRRTTKLADPGSIMGGRLERVNYILARCAGGGGDIIEPILSTSGSLRPTTPKAPHSTISLENLRMSGTNKNSADRL